MRGYILAVLWLSGGAQGVAMAERWVAWKRVLVEAEAQERARVLKRLEQEAGQKLQALRDKYRALRLQDPLGPSERAAWSKALYANIAEQVAVKAELQRAIREWDGKRPEKPKSPKRLELVAVCR